MKQFTRISALIILITVIFSSCSKKDPSPTPSPINNKGVNGSGCVITSIDSNGVNILNYEYNSDNKVSKINNVKNNMIITFSYTPTKVTIQVNKSGTLYNSYLDLGSNGYGKKLYSNIIASSSAKATDTTTYTYDVNNYLIKSIQTVDSYFGDQFFSGFYLRTDNTIDKGNFSTSTYTDGIYYDKSDPAANSQPLLKLAYDYYFDKPAQVFPIGSSKAAQTVIGLLTGTSPKNLLKSITITDPVIVTYSFVYTFTDKSLINTVLITEAGNAQSQNYTLTFHYNCK